MENKGIGFLGGIIILDAIMFYAAKAYHWVSGIISEICLRVCDWFNMAFESVSIWIGSIMAFFGI